MKFRKLKADEIDCRIASIRENGLSLLLYKDARCDMNILDEEVGSMNWQRSHSRDNANCTVSIYDTEKKIWVSKEDTGTESYTEKEKGLASDSFKRACFNWGIGMELYTAPFIWIDSTKCKIEKTGDKYVCREKFKVRSIEYSDTGCISSLVIVNKKNEEVFKFPQTQKPKTAPKTAPKTKNYTLNECMILVKEKGFEKHIDFFKQTYKVDDLSKLTQTQLNDFFNRLCKQPEEK